MKQLKGGYQEDGDVTDTDKRRNQQQPEQTGDIRVKNASGERSSHMIQI
jgi:hypothetical protein